MAKPRPNKSPQGVLVVDIGGSKVKVLASGHHEPRKFPSGKRLKPGPMVERIKELVVDWDYQAVSIGFPGLVGVNGPIAEPANLAPGWVGFDFAAAFQCPVRIVNDAAMQALGVYEGGRMLFLGLGTGLGSTFIADHVLVPLELGRITHGAEESLDHLASTAGMKRMGVKKWRRRVMGIIASLLGAFTADYVVVGGGNARKLDELPEGVRKCNNLAAFRGGYRLWHIDEVTTQTADGRHLAESSMVGAWKLI